MSTTTYRFTADDEAAVTAAIARGLARWAENTDRFATQYLDPAGFDALYRLGCRAIGCSDADLREVEREWVHAQIATAVAA